MKKLILNQNMLTKNVRVEVIMKDIKRMDKNMDLANYVIKMEDTTKENGKIIK